MLRLNKRLIVALSMLALSASASAAEPVTLKLAFFTSETEVNYALVIKPFIDAVNSDPRQAVKIEPFTNGALGKNVQQQPQMVLNGVADIAFINPSLTPGRFPDDQLLELPGLYNSLGEGVRLYEWLIGQRALRGYDDFFMVGSFVAPAYYLFSRKPLKAVGDLRGLKVRIVGSVIGQTAREFGMVPVLMPPNEVVEAIGRGTVDAVTTNPVALIDYGMSRVTKFDFLLPMGAGPLAVIMNQKKFESLSPEAKDTLRQYSNRWINDVYTKAISSHTDKLLGDLSSDAGRVTIKPSPDEMRSAELVYAHVTTEWAARSAENASLLNRAREFLREFRKSQVSK